MSAQEQAHFHSIVVDLSFYLEITRHQHMAGLIDKGALDSAEPGEIPPLTELQPWLAAGPRD